jgi:tetratricopeptide (TPR) repeat protein
LLIKGDYEAALVEYQKALAIQEASLGKDHPDTATTYSNIGSVLFEKGDYEGALVEYQEGSGHSRSKLGQRNIAETAATYMTTLGVCTSLQKMTLKQPWWSVTRLWLIREAELWARNILRHCTFLQQHRGVCFIAKGDYDAALLECQQGFSHSRGRALGKEHPDTATAYSNIGSLCFLQSGDYEAALIEYQKALATQEACFGKEHPDTAATYQQYCSCVAKDGYYKTSL